MDGAEAPAGADDRADDERHVHLLLRQEPVLRRLVDEHVHGEREEVAEHDLDDGAQTRDGRPERSAGEGELRDRSVEHPLRPVLLVQTGRRREDAAGDGDVLAEEDHALVGSELLVERVADSGAEGDCCHQKARASGRSSSSRSRERKRAPSAP